MKFSEIEQCGAEFSLDVLSTTSTEWGRAAAERLLGQIGGNIEPDDNIPAITAMLIEQRHAVHIVEEHYGPDVARTWWGVMRAAFHAWIGEYERRQAIHISNATSPREGPRSPR